jgi:hypothetical protein
MSYYCIFAHKENIIIKMKRHLLMLLSFMLLGNFSYGQFDFGDEIYSISFDDTTQLYRISIDTTFNPENVWEIGLPGKTHFIPRTGNAMVTKLDTVYPVSDTSTFTIHHLNQECAYCWLTIEGYYWVDSDTLTDYGTIEVSFNSGNTWIDVFNDPVWASYINWFDKPVFSGNSDGWKHFGLDLHYLREQFGLGDSILLYRFKFVSDDIQTNRDGLMFDDLYLMEYYSAIKENEALSTFSFSPNPANNMITLKYNTTDKTRLELYSIEGCLLGTFLPLPQLDLSLFPGGVYFLKLIGEGGSCTHKLIIY